MIISDIHGCAPALKQAFLRFDEEKADALAICGDYLNHGPRNPIPDGYEPQSVARLLNEFSHPLITVQGNCDSEVDKMLINAPILQDLSCCLVDDMANATQIIFHHGHKYTKQDICAFAKNKCIVASGHTHIATIQEFAGNLFVNAGSISIPKAHQIDVLGSTNDANGLQDAPCTKQIDANGVQSARQIDDNDTIFVATEPLATYATIETNTKNCATVCIKALQTGATLASCLW